MENTIADIGDKKTSRDVFVKLANKRVTKALKFIRLIGNLSNKSNYSYTEKDVEKIFLALEKALGDCRQRFDGKKKIKEAFNIEEDEQI